MSSYHAGIPVIIVYLLKGHFLVYLSLKILENCHENHVDSVPTIFCLFPGGLSSQDVFCP